MFHACMHSMSSSSHRLSLVAMAFVTFKQYSSFFFIIAILVPLTTASSLSPNKNECVNQYKPTLRKGDDAPTHPRTKNIVHNIEDTDVESWPSTEEGHRVSNPIRTSNAIHEEDTDAESGPSPGEGHGVPIPGEGHGVPSLLRRSHAMHNKENTYEESGPSPGEGHGIPSPMETKNAIHNMEETVDKFAPSPGEGHGIPSPIETKNAIQNKEETVDKSAPSPGEGHNIPRPSGGL